MNYFSSFGHHGHIYTITPNKEELITGFGSVIDGELVLSLMPNLPLAVIKSIAEINTDDIPEEGFARVASRRLEKRQN